MVAWYFTLATAVVILPSDYGRSAVTSRVWRLLGGYLVLTYLGIAQFCCKIFWVDENTSSKIMSLFISKSLFLALRIFWNRLLLVSILIEFEFTFKIEYW
jgi:hypothetical protein